MKSKIMKTTILLICLFFTVGLILSSFGTVLCVSDSGYIKVESVSPLFFDYDFGSSTESEYIVHDDKSDCVDFSLNSSTIHRKDNNTVIYDGYLFLKPTFSLFNVFNNNQDITQSNSKYVQPDFAQSASIISSTIIIC